MGYSVAHVSMYSVRTLMMSLAMAALMQPREASAQERPTVAGSDAWKTDFSKHTVPFEEFASGGPPKDLFRDRETRSTWNLSGKATAGPVAGAQLNEIVHGNHFWFSWAVFRPETEIWRGP